MRHTPEVDCLDCGGWGEVSDLNGPPELWRLEIDPVTCATCGGTGEGESTP